MKIIKLTNEQYGTLVSELESLYNYHWNDDHIHADDCGSKILEIITFNVEDSDDEIC